MEVAIKFVMNEVPRFTLWLILSREAMKVRLSESEAVMAERTAMTKSVVAGGTLLNTAHAENSGKKNLPAVRPSRKLQARSPHLLSFPSARARQTTTPSEMTKYSFPISERTPWRFGTIKMMRSRQTGKMEPIKLTAKELKEFPSVGNGLIFHASYVFRNFKGASGFMKEIHKITNEEKVRSSCDALALGIHSRSLAALPFSP